MHDHSTTCEMTTNALKQDPTRTSTIRDAFAREMIRRFRSIKRDIWDAVVVKDVFGLTGDNILTRNATPPAGAFAFRTDPGKIEGFMAWLQGRVDEGIFEVSAGQKRAVLGNVPWSNVYIDAAYNRGMRRGDAELKKIIPDYDPTRTIDSAFMTPVHADKVASIYTRVYTDLRNVTATMEGEMQAVLAEGIANGDGPRLIARKLQNRIEKSGGELAIVDARGTVRMRAVQRAVMIARTEVIRAHHVATINTYREAGIEGVKVKAEWSTAGDDRVCFTKGTNIVSRYGNSHIEDIKKGDEVLTRDGFQKVFGIMSKEHTGNMTLLMTNKGITYVTSDHPYLVGSDWISAGKLRAGDVLQSANDEIVHVLRLHNFDICNATNKISHFLQSDILPPVFVGGVPVSSIDFQCELTNEKVDEVFPGRKFLNEVYSKAFKAFSSNGLNARLPSKLPVTTSRTEDSGLFRCNSDGLSTISTINVAGRTATLLRTVFVKAKFTASLTFLLLAVGFISYLDHTLGAMNSSLSLHAREILSATLTGHGLVSISLLLLTIALPAAILTRGTKANALASRIKNLSTFLTDFIRLGLTTFIIASLRTIAGSVLLPLKRFSTLFAFECKWHINFLLIFCNRLYSRLMKKSTTVYNLSVMNHPEYFADGALVHNCPDCATLEGVAFTLDEIEPLIPLHPMCRCVALPLPGSDKTGRRSDAEIEKSVGSQYRRKDGSWTRKGFYEEKTGKELPRATKALLSLQASLPRFPTAMTNTQSHGTTKPIN